MFMVDTDDEGLSARSKVENGTIRGKLLVVPKPGVPGTVQRNYVSFRQVDIISYLSNWVVSGIASASSREAPLYLELSEERNALEIAIGAVRWNLAYPSDALSVFNAPSEGRLTIEVRRSVFSSNDEVYRLDAQTLIHVQKDRD